MAQATYMPVKQSTMNIHVVLDNKTIVRQGDKMTVIQ